MDKELKLSQDRGQKHSFYQNLLIYLSKVFEMPLPCSLSQIYFVWDQGRVAIRTTPHVVNFQNLESLYKKIHEKGICGLQVYSEDSDDLDYVVQLDWVRLNQIENLTDYLSNFDLDYRELRQILKLKNADNRSLYLFKAEKEHPSEVLCISCDYSSPKEATLCFNCGQGWISPSEAHYEITFGTDIDSEKKIEFVKKYIEPDYDFNRRIKSGQLLVVGISQKTGLLLLKRAESFGVELSLKEQSTFSDLKSPMIRMSKVKESALKAFDRVSWFKKSLPFLRMVSHPLLNRIKGDFFKLAWYLEQEKQSVSLVLVDTFFHEYMRWLQLYEAYLNYEQNTIHQPLWFNHFVNHFSEIYLKFVNVRNSLIQLEAFQESQVLEELKDIYESMEAFDEFQNVLIHTREAS